MHACLLEIFPASKILKIDTGAAFARQASAVLQPDIVQSGKAACINEALVRGLLLLLGRANARYVYDLISASMATLCNAKTNAFVNLRV